MADDDDMTVLNEEENELDRLLQENGHDPAEFDLQEKRDLASDLVGSTDISVTNEPEPDAMNDGLPGAVPPEEQDGTDP